MQGSPANLTRLNTGAKPMLTSTSGQHFLTPNDFATIYDLGSVYAAGNSGAKVGSKAQRIANLGRSRVAWTDISEFESLTGLPSAQPNVIIPTGGLDPGTTNGGDQDEATLDVDRVMGTAPGVGVDLVVSADTKTVSGIYTAAAYEVNTLLDPIMTISLLATARRTPASRASACEHAFLGRGGGGHQRDGVFGRLGCGRMRTATARRFR